MHTKYLLIRDDSRTGLEEAIEINLSNGWKLYDATRIVSHAGGLIYYQAMTKGEV
jgi:hypothetical protein